MRKMLQKRGGGGEGVMIVMSAGLPETGNPHKPRGRRQQPASRRMSLALRLMGSCPKSGLNYFGSNSWLNSSSLGRTRLFFSEAKVPQIKTIRRYKRLFAVGLFGVTLVTAILVKRHRREDWAKMLSQAKRLQGHKFGDHQLYSLDGFVLVEAILKIWKELHAFEFRPDDVLVTSFPKTGTTWLSEIVYLIANDMNLEEAKSKNISERVPYLEFPSPGLGTIGKQKGSRLIKTHLPPSLLFPDQDPNSDKPVKTVPKIISIIRNPKDTMVSYYYFSRMNYLISFKGDFEEFYDMFVGDFVAYGPIWKHYLDVIKFEKTLGPNRVLVIQYEDLMRDFKNQVDKISYFLGKDKLPEEQMKVLSNHCSFKSMSENPSVNYQHWDELGLRNKSEAAFMRKGKIGDWKNTMTPLQSERFDKWIKINFHHFVSFTFE